MPKIAGLDINSRSNPTLPFAIEHGVVLPREITNKSFTSLSITTEGGAVTNFKSPSATIEDSVARSPKTLSTIIKDSCTPQVS